MILKCLLENNDFESLFDLCLSEQDIILALKEIKEAVDKEHILSAPLLETMHGDAVSNLEELVNTQMKGITLELTEECNLRCKYCIYHPLHPSYREFGKKPMSLEIAKKSIDLLKSNSNEKDEMVYVGFYGGEPLLNFSVLQETIEYANQLFLNQKFSII